MRRVIEIDADDMDAIKSTVMSVDEMCNTLQGRIYSAVAGSKDIQVIDVREQPGHWKKQSEMGFGGPCLCLCSQCGGAVYNKNYHYCPHCGVRMV